MSRRNVFRASETHQRLVLDALKCLGVGFRSLPAAKILDSMEPGILAPYFGRPVDQLDELLAACRIWLDQQVVLALISDLEACFQQDFHDRLDGKKGLARDPLVQPFHLKRHERRRSGKKVVWHDLITVWLEIPGAPRNILNELTPLLEYRHWLAHGRWWTEPDRRFDPDGVRLIADTLFKTLPGFP